MPRAFILVLDSFGIGAAPDAAQFGDEGSDTFGHIASACADGKADHDGLRAGPLNIPNMNALGLGRAANAYTGTFPAGMNGATPVTGQWGYAVEQSRGKDTPSGHWEIAGAPVQFDWGYFPKEEPAFPAELTEAMIGAAGLPGILGNKHASGTGVIEEFGAEHMRTGKPIAYTSADSVIQIAAHEENFGLERLYELCRVTRQLADPYDVGRVIARPFMGDGPENFERTANRRDYSIPPPEATLLDMMEAAERPVITIGKIGDIFAHQATGTEIKAAGNNALFDVTLEAAGTLPDGGLAFANFVDFDTQFGHRRDVAGYAAALEAFDWRLPELQDQLKSGDLVILTADHGCDPTFPGTDHTRECVPVLAFGPNIAPGTIGRRDSFADIGQTVAHHLGIGPLAHGKAWVV